MTPLPFSRGQMVREATLTEADLVEVDKCRRGHNRLGFAYQVGFVRLFNRFPAQQPLEICDELLGFVAMQLNVDVTGSTGTRPGSIRSRITRPAFGNTSS